MEETSFKHNFDNFADFAVRGQSPVSHQGLEQTPCASNGRDSHYGAIQELLLQKKSLAEDYEKDREAWYQLRSKLDAMENEMDRIDKMLGEAFQKFDQLTKVRT